LRTPLLTPASLTLPPMTPCELRLNSCILHQRTIFLSLHPTYWTLSQWSHNVSSTPSHGALTSAPLSARLSIEWECTASQNETPISYPLLNNSSVHLTTKSEVGGMQTSWSALRESALSSLTHPPGMTLLRTACTNAAGIRPKRPWPPLKQTC